MSRPFNSKLAVPAIFLLLLTACPESARKEARERDFATAEDAAPSDPPDRFYELEYPSDGDTFRVGDEIGISLVPTDDVVEVLSVRLNVDGEEKKISYGLPGMLSWNTSGSAVGTRQLRLALNFREGGPETHFARITLKSDLVPQQYTYHVINSYPHDIRAFTQGLVFYEGFLYESTGQYGQSSLRKVDLESGQVVRSHNLDRELFGEGLCVHDGKLYQLTWKSRVGFIYDIETFRMLNRVYYQTEGWGLTSDGVNLLKSDGSHYIYLLDPVYFSENGRFEVFDHNGRVEGLNELEFIDGVIYANVFGKEEIVKIEHMSGRVLGVVDLTGILDQRYHHPNLDVLNGIAYDHENGRLFVTGKNWPRLFEIELVER